MLLEKRRSAIADLFREEGAKGALLAAVSTLAFFGIAIAVILNSPNWDRIQQQFFNGEDFVASWSQVVSGFWLNLELFAYSMLAIPVVALIVAVTRSFRGAAFFPIRLLSVIYTDVFRGIPLILLILLLGFGIPALQLNGLPTSSVFWGLFALTLSYSAYTAEIYRAGIDAVPESQRSSARALGAHTVAGPAIRHRPPGDPQRRSRTHEHRRQPAKGCGAHQRAGSPRRGASRRDLHHSDVQLHLVPCGDTLVPGDLDSVDALCRLVHRSGPSPTIAIVRYE